MTTKSITLSEDLQKTRRAFWKLQAELKRLISIEDAIKYLMREIISDLAGSWEMSGEEEKEIKESLSKGWKAWKFT